MAMNGMWIIQMNLSIFVFQQHFDLTHEFIALIKSEPNFYWCNTEAMWGAISSGVFFFIGKLVPLE